MKKILRLFISSVVILIPSLTLAQENPPNSLKPNIASEKDLIDKINYISDIVFGILLAVAIAMIVVAAFQFLTAGGSTEKVQKARKALMYAVIAVVIAVASKGIVKVVGSLIGRTDLNI